MPLTTRDDRAAVLGFVYPPAVVYPDPDNALVSLGDRAQMAYSWFADATAATEAQLKIGPEYYLITVAEITEVTDITNIGIYNEDAYNRGRVYGS